MIWTEAELQYLKENAAKGSTVLAQELNKTKNQVIGKAYIERISLRRVKGGGRRLNPNLKVDTHRSRKGITLEKIQISPFSEEMLTKYPNALKANNGRLWRQRRQIILKMHDHVCYYCGDLADTVDHIVDRQHGGTDQISNLVAACQECNYGKVNKVKYLIAHKMGA